LLLLASTCLIAQLPGESRQRYPVGGRAVTELANHEVQALSLAILACSYRFTSDNWTSKSGKLHVYMSQSLIGCLITAGVA
jgi:hypothetical protein